MPPRCGRYHVSLAFVSTDEPVQSESENEGDWRILEEDQRFSRSVLWTLMKEYYDRKGPSAWFGEVPNYSTCNTYIAQCYVDMVMSYLRDLARTNKLDRGAPVYIIELAAGIGAFANYFLHAIADLKQESSLRDIDIRYVMTDFTPTNLKATSEHPHLRPFAASGMLDFGKFDVDTDDAIQLKSGGTLGAGSCKNPIVVLANYAFDTFRHDIFRIENSKLHEVTVTTRGSASQPPELGKTQTRYGKNVIDETTYYENPLWKQLLVDYKALLAETAFTIPVGSLRALDHLLELSGGRGLLLSSDKGYTHVDELYNPNPESMQLHGSFSVMVNYHAIGRYCALRGGEYMATQRRVMSLKTAMCIFGDRADCVDTLSLFKRRIDDFGPGEWFDFVMRERKTEKSIEQMLHLIRMSGYDPTMLYGFAADIREKCQGMPEWLNVEVRLAIDRAWSNYFVGPQNLPFELGRLLLALGRPFEAARFNQIAIDWFGDNPGAHFNMGVCYYYAENPQQALKCFERAKQIDPDYGPPHEWIARIHAERARAVTAPKLPPRAPPVEPEKPARTEANRDADSSSQEALS